MKVEMNKIPKSSVIVPVYKAEAYLHRCVDSLLAQTFTNYEVILVDDGSPDRSGEICDEYARKDDRVKVIHQPNGGVSMARQKGLDNARGEYVIHADPDDWVEPDMLEQLYAKAKEEDADMVICDYYTHYSEKMNYVQQKPSALDHTTVLCELFQQLHGSCCNKLVRRVCYNKFQIKFPVGVSYCEDLLTNATLLSHDIKVAYLTKAFYHYDQGINPNSLVSNYNRQDFQRNEQLFRLMSKALEGTSAQEMGRRSVAKSLLLRTFRGHYFSGSEFRQYCRKYKRYCFPADSIVMGAYLYISCMGMYEIAYRCWDATRTLKAYIKRILKAMNMNELISLLGGGKSETSIIYTVTCLPSPSGEALRTTNLTRMAA